MHQLLLKVLLIFLLFISIKNLTFSQIIWEKLDNLKYFQPEDVALTSSGKIYVSVFGQNKILESMDQGNSWKNIVQDTFKYFSFNIQKKLFINHKDSIVEFFYDSGIPIPRYYDGNKLYPDPLFKTKNAILGDENIKYNQKNEYFYLNSRELRKYRQTFFDSDIVFNNGDIIRNYFVFNDSINYVITEKGTYRIYKLNTKTNQSKQIVSALIVSNPKLVLMNENGRVLIPTVSGLYLSDDEGVNTHIVIFDNQIDPQTNITDLRRTKDGGIIMRADKDYYYSNDEGDNWIKLDAFNNSCPDYFQIIKLEAVDTQLAVMIVKDKCDLESTFILTPLWNAWRTITTDVSVLDMSTVIKTNKNKLIANDHLCEVVYSEDDSKSWNPYLIENKNISSITAAKSKTLFAITREKRELYRSIDHGENWTYISDLIIGIPTIEVISIKHIVGDTIILIGGIKDSGKVSYRDTFEFLTKNNGDTWQFLPNNTSRYIYNLVWDGSNKIYSYFSHLNTIYSSSDLGISWNIDHLLDGFDKINSLVFGKNNLIILYGRYKGEYNVYLSYDRVNFIPCNGDYFKNDVVTFAMINDTYIVALLGINGIFFSKDGGLNWQDISSGIRIFDELITPINSIFFDTMNRAYLSIQNDGLYKSIDPLVKTEGNIILDSKLLSYPNPFVNDLIVKCDWCLNEPNNELEIYNNVGILIYKTTLLNEFNQLHFLNALTSGLYVLQLKKSGILYHSSKLIKL